MKLQSIKQNKWLHYILFGVVGLGLIILVSRQAQASPYSQDDHSPLEASGVIQAQEISIASEFGGLIAAIPVQEGDKVAAGDLLVQLDTALLDSQIEAAEALVAVAEAGLAQARAGTRPGQIAVAEAQRDQAQAAVNASRQAVSDTLALVETPQDVDLQIAITRGQLGSAEHQLAQAVALKDSVEVAKEKFDEAYGKWGNDTETRVPAASGNVADLGPDTLPDLPPEIRDIIPDPSELPGLPDGDYEGDEWGISIQGGQYTIYKIVGISFPVDASLLPNTWWRSWIGVNSAGARKDGLEAKLGNLYQQRANPQAMQAQADQAASTYAQMEAQLAMADAQLAGYEAGATPEQLAVIEAQLAQAQAALNSLVEQRAMLALDAPVAGTILDIVAYPGEACSAGAQLLTLANLEDMTLTVYVPETQFGRIYTGQAVAVTVDSFPGQVFQGQVKRISGQAEFTPRNVSTKEERVNLVFAVDISISNTESVLKPGMPADATF